MKKMSSKELLAQHVESPLGVVQKFYLAGKLETLTWEDNYLTVNIRPNRGEKVPVLKYTEQVIFCRREEMQKIYAYLIDAALINKFAVCCD